MSCFRISLYQYTTSFKSRGSRGCCFVKMTGKAFLSLEAERQCDYFHHETIEIFCLEATSDGRTPLEEKQLLVNVFLPFSVHSIACSIRLFFCFLVFCLMLFVVMVVHWTRVSLMSSRKLSSGTSLRFSITRLIRCLGPKPGGTGPGAAGSSRFPV